MIKHIIALAILAQLAHAQDAGGEPDMADFETEVVSEWSIGPYLSDLNEQCVDDCNRTCTKDCPEAKLCGADEIQCGKEPLPAGVWPDCIKDDICVDDDCECPVDGDDGSQCPLWCVTYCTPTQIKCPGGKDDNNCKERDTCIERPVSDDNTLCPHWCPEPCDPETEHVCPNPPINGCPQPPTCKTKEVDHDGDYCDEQHCKLVCEEPYKFCAGDQMLDGCMEADICVVKGKTSDDSAYCDGNCPVKCRDEELLCDGTIIYGGEKDGCTNDDTCTSKARDANGVYCDDSSDSHDCPVTCPPDTHRCPTATDALNCKEQAYCKECSRDNDGDCCPPASDCPALCQDHEKPCEQDGTDDNGCDLPDVCVVVERDYYGNECEVHCPGVCDDNQIMCPGCRCECGCPKPSFCEPLSKKLWGVDEGDWCPGFCPACCKDWEQVCPSVQDPCDGCPTESVCKPKATDVNGVNCPPESASHGCSISCKTLDGLETICAAYEDPTAPGCQEPLTCLARTTGNDGSLCPSHSVCPKKCAANEKQCVQGMDDNDCKLEDLCIPVPADAEFSQPCLSFECPPVCDEEVQRYCQGLYVRDLNGQLCPQRDYCVDRPLDNNSIRCPGHCQPECQSGYEAQPQSGTDIRGCPLIDVCVPV